MLPYIRLLLFLCISSRSLKMVIARTSIDETYIGDIQVQNSSNLYLLASDINEDIESGRLHKAEEKILQIGIQPSIIRNVLNILSKINDNNLQLLIDECALSSQTLIQYSIYEPLFERLISNDETDLFGLISRYEILTNIFIHQEEAPEEIRMRAKALRDNGFRNAIIRRSAKIINDAVFGGYYENSRNIKMLAKTLESLDEQISDETFRKVVENLYFKLPITDLIRNVYNSESVSQSVTALVSIHESLSIEDDLYGVIGLLFAEYLSRLQQMPDYAKLSEDKKTASTRLVNNISNSIRNLYFSRKTCIRNALFLESIYSPTDDYKWNTAKRHVFTWVKRAVDAQTQWIPKQIVLENQEFVFQFESDFNKNEYLYIPSIPPYSDQYRHVMTWRSEGERALLSYSRILWRIQAIKKELVLINLLFNEYLCLSDEKFSDDRRYVFTKRDVELSSNPPKECLWIFDAC